MILTRAAGKQLEKKERDDENSNEWDEEDKALMLMRAVYLQCCFCLLTIPILALLNFHTAAVSCSLI